MKDGFDSRPSIVIPIDGTEDGELKGLVRSSSIRIGDISVDDWIRQELQIDIGYNLHEVENGG